jgi:hypothetical protein
MAGPTNALILPSHYIKVNPGSLEASLGLDKVRSAEHYSAVFLGKTSPFCSLFLYSKHYLIHVGPDQDGGVAGRPQLTSQYRRSLCSGSKR